MSRDHIIPRFILRGFAIDPTEDKNKQKIMIYDRETNEVEIKKIVDAYAIRDFNSPETEQHLAHKYENKVASIFQRISDATNNNQQYISFSDTEYRLLFRFFVIMWRRNNIHLEKAKEICTEFEIILKPLLGDHYKNALKPEYKNYSMEEMFNEKNDDIRYALYDKIIKGTKDDDPTVLKTIKHYFPFIVNNKSKIHFLLHNTYSTLVYLAPQNQYYVSENDFPQIMIYPISKTLCLCMMYNKEEIDTTKEKFDIPIEICDNDKDIKSTFIDAYITRTTKSFVVDDTNLCFVKI